jgi:hypothetical protein
MNLKKIVRNEKNVAWTAELKGKGDSDEEHKVTSKEAPLESFELSRMSLRGIVCRILSVGPSWEAGLTPLGLSISTTKNGTQSVSIHFEKNLSGKISTWTASTPYFQIDKSADGEAGERWIDKKDAELIAAFIQEGMAYVRGDRQQQELPLDGVDDSDLDGADELSFGESGAPDPDEISFPADKASLLRLAEQYGAHAVKSWTNSKIIKSIKSELTRRRETG